MENKEDLKNELENVEKDELEEKKDKLINSLKNNVWGYSKAGLAAKEAAMSMLATKTGMYAKVPLYCKADNCPYAETCMVLQNNMCAYGEPCPIETAQIELRIAGYNQDFNIDESSFTDRVLISEIVNLDILIERCKALMAKDGTPVVDVVITTTQDGEPIMSPDVSKALEAYDKLVNRRNTIYSYMKATRKDKKQTVEEVESIQTILTRAVERKDNGSFIVEKRPEGI